MHDIQPLISHPNAELGECSSECRGGTCVYTGVTHTAVQVAEQMRFCGFAQKSFLNTEASSRSRLFNPMRTWWWASWITIILYR